MRKNILIGLSGGPSAAINASLAGVIQEASACGEYSKIYGALHGVQGVLDDKLIDLSPYTDERSLRLLQQTPAMALGSCRRKLKPEDYSRIDEVFAQREIGAFFYIGGNDSMDTIEQLSRHLQGSDVRVVGVPKTIDNDLRETDHTPGFGSSAKYLYTTMREIIRDSEIYPVKNVVIVEIMGRNSGWLTLAAGLPAFLGQKYPQIVAIPEVPFDEFGFLDKIRTLFDAGERTIVCAVSEGVRDRNGTYVGMEQKSGVVDAFGHTYLSGVGKYLEYLVMEKIGCKVRSIELNVMQRCSAHLAAKSDLDEAVWIGRESVRAALDGKSGVMMAFRRISDAPYRAEVVPVDVSLVANQAKDVPERWFCLEDEAVRKEIAAYLLPLMQGEIEFIRNENGFPEFIDLK
jgi:6-phosphofructokinase